MGLFGFGKKNKKSSSFAPAKKAPKDILSFEDHVNGAHAVMASQDTSDFDPEYFTYHFGHELNKEFKEKFGEVSGRYMRNKYGYVLNMSYGQETPPEEFDWHEDGYGSYSPPTTLLPYLKKEKREILISEELPGVNSRKSPKSIPFTGISSLQRRQCP